VYKFSIVWHVLSDHNYNINHNNNPNVTIGVIT